jgi:hypothetical protein
MALNPSRTGLDPMPRQSAASLAFPGVIRTERVSPPADLRPCERMIFLDIVSACKADHFQPGDVPLLIAYVRAILAERTAAEHLAVHSRVGLDNKLNAWFTVQMMAQKSMLQLSRSLKLSPIARRPSPSRSGRPQRPLSIYEQMDLERHDGAV